MKRNIFYTLLILIGITFLGGFLRFYKNTQNPPSLNGDEISFGYSAYSVLKTGRDEFGSFLPLVFKSVGDYKNPVPVYLMILPIKFFGLTDFAVRFPNAFFGTITIPIFFLFLMYIFKDRKTALIGSFLVSVSALFIFYSRFAYEPLIASIFDLIGIWAFMKLLDGEKKWIFVSAFFLVLSMYTGFSTRLFTPVFIGVLSLYLLLKRQLNLKSLILFLMFCAVLVAPLAYTIIFKGAGTRLTMVLISNDIEFSRYVLLKGYSSIRDFPLLFIFWMKRYLDYIHPDFLFFNGLHMTTFDIFGLGLLYLFEIPWFILGIFSFIQKKIPHKDIFVIWLLTGIFPDSITNNQQQGGRLLHAAPIIILITTLGLIQFAKWITNIKNIYSKVAISAIYCLLIILVLMHAFLTFAAHFPDDKGESYDEGLKEAVEYIGSHQDKYKEIVFDPQHGVDAPSLISNPYLYILFYLKYDPHTYQTEPRYYSTTSDYFYKFNKYTFRHINWQDDKNKKDVLFIGSPWSMPEKDLKNGELLDKIYLSNGKVAYYIVTP